MDRTPLDPNVPAPRIELMNTQQTTIAVSFARDGKSASEPGDALAIASGAVSMASAIWNADTGLIDVIPVEGALGDFDVSVTATLADGTVLPTQTVGYTLIHPDADALVLTPGSIVDKTVFITNPAPNPDPWVFPPPPPAPAPPPLPPVKPPIVAPAAAKAPTSATA